MSSITIEASKVARKSPIRVDTSLVGTVSGVEDVTVSLPSATARLSVGKWGYKSNTITVEHHCFYTLLEVVTSHSLLFYLL